MNIAANAIVYRFTVTERRVVPAFLKALVVVATRETDLVFSPSRRVLETAVLLSAKKPVCEIDTRTECGHLSRLLAGFLIKQVGGDGFVVRRICRRSGRRTEEVP